MSFLRPIDSRPTLLCNVGNERKCRDRLRLFAENVARHRNEQALCRRRKSDPRNTRNHANRPEIRSQMTEVRKIPVRLGLSRSLACLAEGLDPRRNGPSGPFPRLRSVTVCLELKG